MRIKEIGQLALHLIDLVVSKLTQGSLIDPFNYLNPTYVFTSSSPKASLPRRGGRTGGGEGGFTTSPISPLLAAEG
jgi:hypothetical protein